MNKINHDSLATLSIFEVAKLIFATSGGGGVRDIYQAVRSGVLVPRKGMQFQVVPGNFAGCALSRLYQALPSQEPTWVEWDGEWVPDSIRAVALKLGHPNFTVGQDGEQVPTEGLAMMDLYKKILSAPKWMSTVKPHPRGRLYTVSVGPMSGGAGHATVHGEPEKLTKAGVRDLLRFVAQLGCKAEWDVSSPEAIAKLFLLLRSQGRGKKAWLMIAAAKAVGDVSAGRPTRFKARLDGSSMNCQGGALAGFTDCQAAMLAPGGFYGALIKHLPSDLPRWAASRDAVKRVGSPLFFGSSAKGLLSRIVSEDPDAIVTLDGIPHLAEAAVLRPEWKGMVEGQVLQEAGNLAGAYTASFQKLLPKYKGWVERIREAMESREVQLGVPYQPTVSHPNGLSWVGGTYNPLPLDPADGTLPEHRLNRENFAKYGMQVSILGEIYRCLRPVNLTSALSPVSLSIQRYEHVVREVVDRMGGGQQVIHDGFTCSWNRISEAKKLWIQVCREISGGSWNPVKDLSDQLGVRSPKDGDLGWIGDSRFIGCSVG